MIYSILLAAFLMFLVGSFISYRKEIHVYWWFPVIMCSISMCGGLLWSFACKCTPDRSRIMILSIYWDVMMATAYYFIPIIIGSVEINKFSATGILLIVFGLILIHK